jgi:hypothetical protein
MPVTVVTACAPFGTDTIVTDKTLFIFDLCTTASPAPGPEPVPAPATAGVKAPEPHPVPLPVTTCETQLIALDQAGVLPPFAKVLLTPPAPTSPTSPADTK